MKAFLTALYAAAILFVLFSCARTPENKTVPDDIDFQKKLDSLKKRTQKNDSIKNLYELKMPKRKSKAEELDTMKAKTI